MTEMLMKYLELGLAPDNSRRKEIIESVPKELATEHDGKIVKVRELLQSEAIESTTLIQSEVLATVIEGAQPAKCMRNALPIINVKSNSLRVPLGETGTYASLVAEGAEVPVDTQDYTSATFTIKKYGVRPLITRELVEDGLVDVIAEELKLAGLKLENKLNQVALSTILEGSGQEHDTGGSNQGLTAVAVAHAKVVGAGFYPDSLVMHPAAAGIMAKDFLPTGGYFQVGDVTTTGAMPPQILGMKSGVCGVSDTSATYTWGYAADNDIGMLVMDSSRAGAIAMRRDISVERYDDPVRDLVGAVATMRFDVQAFIANATCRIKY